MPRYATIRSTGRYLPEIEVSNDVLRRQLAHVPDFVDKMEAGTGILRRWYAPVGRLDRQGPSHRRHRHRHDRLGRPAVARQSAGPGASSETEPGGDLQYRRPHLRQRLHRSAAGLKRARDKRQSPQRLFRGADSQSATPGLIPALVLRLRRCVGRTLQPVSAGARAVPAQAKACATPDPECGSPQIPRHQRFGDSSRPSKSRLESRLCKPGGLRHRGEILQIVPYCQ